MQTATRQMLIALESLLWATAVAYVVAWQNVYKEDDIILYQVVNTVEEDKED